MRSWERLFLGHNLQIKKQKKVKLTLLTELIGWLVIQRQNIWKAYSKGQLVKATLYLLFHISNNMHYILKKLLAFNFLAVITSYLCMFIIIFDGHKKQKFCTIFLEIYP